MSDIVKATCPQCKHSLRIPVELLDKKVRCKHCNAVIRPKSASIASALPAPPIIVPLPVVAPNPETIQPVLPEAPEPIIRLAPRPQPTRIAKWIRLAVSLGLLAAAGVVVVVFWDHFRSAGQNLREIVEEQIDPNKSGSGKDKAATVREPVVASGPVFPRRLLALFPSEYLYANRVSPGIFDRSFASVVEHLVRGLHVDPGQVLVVSDESADGISARKREKNKRDPPTTPLSFQRSMPTRPLFEKACTEFLAASRPQDHVVILFIGHIATIDDKGYLAPLEGDLANKETLIPLSWLYEKLGQCKARQKVLILDTCRLDPGRGTDRPASGPMSAAFAKALEQPPAGVEVWSPCSADQYSYEIDGQSVFLDKLCETLATGGWVAGDKPENALPLPEMREPVDTLVQKEVSKVLKVAQKPFGAGKMAEQGTDYDAGEPLPPRLVLTAPEPASPPAAAEDVRQILKELRLPPIQLSMAEEHERMDLNGVVFFAKDKLAPYLPDYRSLDEIRKQPEKYPLRIAVLDTLQLLNTEFGSGKAKETIRQFYSATGAPEAKNRILNEQKKPAQLLLSLQEARARLEKAGESREEEKTKRWQANYDYTYAELLARIAFLEEYNLMLGRIRKDELPELEKGVDEGWRLTPREKVQSPKDVRDIASLAHKTFDKLAKDHAGTPWEVLARREKATSLGLQWQPSKR